MVCMTEKIVLVSEEDKSINYIIPTADKGYFESRFVQRTDDYFIVYLSSHSGCNQACKFCHLTQTKQTMMTPSTLEDYVRQALNVLNNVDQKELKANGLKRVKFSFMARGEPLLNSTILDNWDELRRALKSLIDPYFDVEFCISTIFPKAFNRSLESIFKTPDVVLYYSIYSTNQKFRRKWLGKAHSTTTALTAIMRYHQTTSNRIKFHSAFIENENDSTSDVHLLASEIKHYMRNIPYKFNIVRYNPYSEDQGVESPRLDGIQSQLKAKVISRVGPDVQASCGMFYAN